MQASSFSVSCNGSLSAQWLVPYSRGMLHDPIKNNAHEAVLALSVAPTRTSRVVKLSWALAAAVVVVVALIPLFVVKKKYPSLLHATFRPRPIFIL